MSRQFLDEAADVAAVTIVARLCGVQAQVARCAEQALAIRQANPRPGQVDQALTDRTIIKTWAMRGTLHLLSADSAAAYLSLMAAARTWEQGKWQRAFAAVGQVTAITHAAGQALASAVLTRDELIAEIVRHTNDTSLSEQLRSGWGALLKPVAWQGYLINGPSDGSLVTFTSPRTWVPGGEACPNQRRRPGWSFRHISVPSNLHR